MLMLEEMTDPEDADVPARQFRSQADSIKNQRERFTILTSTWADGNVFHIKHEHCSGTR